jgi:hypothetical protein
VSLCVCVLKKLKLNHTKGFAGICLFFNWKATWLQCHHQVFSIV